MSKLVDLFCGFVEDGCCDGEVYACVCYCKNGFVGMFFVDGVDECFGSFSEVCVWFEVFGGIVPVDFVPGFSLIFSHVTFAKLFCDVKGDLRMVLCYCFCGVECSSEIACVDLVDLFCFKAKGEFFCLFFSQGGEGSVSVSLEDFVFVLFCFSVACEDEFHWCWWRKGVINVVYPPGWDNLKV